MIYKKYVYIYIYIYMYIIVKRQEKRWLTEISAANQHWFQYESVLNDLPCVQFERRHSGKERLKTRIVLITDLDRLHQRSKLRVLRSPRTPSNVARIMIDDGGGSC